MPPCLSFVGSVSARYLVIPFLAYTMVASRDVQAVTWNAWRGHVVQAIVLRLFQMMDAGPLRESVCTYMNVWSFVDGVAKTIESLKAISRHPVPTGLDQLFNAMLALMEHLRTCLEVASDPNKRLKLKEVLVLHFTDVKQGYFDPSEMVASDVTLHGCTRNHFELWLLYNASSQLHIGRMFQLFSSLQACFHRASATQATHHITV